MTDDIAIAPASVTPAGYIITDTATIYGAGTTIKAAVDQAETAAGRHVRRATAALLAQFVTDAACGWVVHDCGIACTREELSARFRPGGSEIVPTRSYIGNWS